MPNKFKLTLASFVMMSLTACGGGGGGGSSIELQPVESTELFQLEDAWVEFVVESSSYPFTLSGEINDTDVNGTGTATFGQLTTSSFEEQDSLAKSATITYELIVDDQTLPLSSFSTAYYDVNYMPLGRLSESEYMVVESLTEPTNIARVNDTGVLYTGTRYSDSNKNTVLGTTQTSYVLEPDTAQTAILKMTSIDKDNSGAIESTGMVAYRVTPAGSITRLYETYLSDSSNLRISY